MEIFTDLENFRNFTALEYRLYKFYERVKYLTRFDNNDAPNVIWGDLHDEVDGLETELKRNFKL